MHFLVQCLYPSGDTAQRVPISTALLPVAPLLDSTVGKLPDGDVRTLCLELAVASGRALEFYAGSKLSAFLNKTLPKLPKPKKPTEKQRRRDALAMQRRRNKS